MVHQYKNNGYNIVLDSNSGSVHVVDEVAYDIIGLYADHDAAEIIRVVQDKYPEVSESDIRDVFSDIEQLSRRASSFPRIIMRIWPLTSKTVIQLSRHSVCISPTIAIWHVNTVLPAKANIPAARRS